jgi:hypothetical protein
MGIKRKSKNLAAGTSVALATAGLSSCNDNGAVDPPPPPLECNSVDNGETLSAAAALAGTELRVTIRNLSPTVWAAVAVTAVDGGTARPLHPAEPLVVVIDLTDGTVTRGSFRLSGTLEGSGNFRCAVTRVFTFTIGSGGVVVASALDLPLPARQQARIALVARDGHDVDLEASTPFGGPHTIAWTVSGGAIVSQDGARLRWRLPPEAGLYQAELVVDYGAWGLSLDTLVLEVS